jgi:D-lactate dehydrogenase
MKTIAFYDAKSYDREFMGAAEGAERLRWIFHEFRLTAETAASARGADAVCGFVNDRLDRPCLQTLANLGVRHVALRCAGFNNVDSAAARELGIAVTRVPSYSPHAVAEHTVALLLSLNRHIHRAYNRVREQNFALHGLVGFDLFGKTCGIVGTGKIGRITAQILRGFGMRVLAHDPFPSAEWAAANAVAYRPLAEVFGESDVLSLHLPLSPATHHLIDAPALAQMKSGSILVNTSRGKLLDTAAVIAALKTGQLAGVALDVYEEEEGVFFEDLSGTVLQDDELARLLVFPNVLITAHQAFLTREALGEIARVTTTNLAAGPGGFLPGTVVE